MSVHKTIRKSGVILGRNIYRMREAKGLTQKELGRKINMNQQQIVKYEAGEFVPLPVLEKIGLALDEQVSKKIIRKISFMRKLEVEKKAEYEDELIELYNEALPEIEED